MQHPGARLRALVEENVAELVEIDADPSEQVGQQLAAGSDWGHDSLWCAAASRFIDESGLTRAEYDAWYDGEHAQLAGVVPADAPTVGLVLQKSHINTKDDAHYVALIMELEAQGAVRDAQGEVVEGFVPQIHLAATHEKTLEHVPLETLLMHAIDAEEAQASEGVEVDRDIDALQRL